MDAVPAFHLLIKRLKEEVAKLKHENRSLRWYKNQCEVYEQLDRALRERIYKFEVDEMDRKGKKTVTIPFLAVGNEELEGQPSAKKGDMFDCPHCPEKHPLECGKNEKGEESDLLLFYKCYKTGNAYLAGMHGKLLPPFKPKGAAN